MKKILPKKLQTKQYSKYKLFLFYSLFFLLFLIVGFFPLIIGHYDSINKYDGTVQYLPFLAGFQEKLKSFLSLDKNYASWDWTSGIGASFFDRYLYYNLGDIFSYFSIFFKREQLPIFFTVVVFMRIYLTGLAMIAYLNYKRGHFFTNIIGGLVYAFNIYLLFNTLLNPIFINALILFPLIILGIDKLLVDKNNRFLIFVAILTLISNFYFASIIAIAALIYVIILFFGKYSKNISFIQYVKQFIKPIIYISGLSAFFVIPLLYTVSIMSRSSDLFSNGIMIFNLRYYLNVLSSLFVFTDPNSNYWMLGSINLMALFSFVFIIRRYKKYKVLSLSLLASFITLLLPMLTSLLTGGGSPVLRWMFILHFISAISLTILIDCHKEITIKDVQAFFTIVAIVFTLNFMGTNFSFKNPNTTFLLIMIIIFSLVVLVIKTKRSLIITTLLFSVINMLIFLTPIGFNYLEEYYPEKGSAKKMLDSYYPSELENLTGPDGRIAFAPKSLTSLTPDGLNYSGNYSSINNLYTIRSYNSIQNKYYFEFISNVLKYNQNKTLISTENSLHPELLKFLGVKYLAVPSNYEENDVYERKLLEIEDHTIYETSDSLPLIFSSSSFISEKEIIDLSPFEKIDLLNNAIVIEDKHNDKFTIERDYPVDFQIVLDDKIEQDGEKDLIIKKGQEYTLDLLESYDQNFYYFVEVNGIKKLDYSLKNSYRQTLTVGSNNDIYNKILFVKNNYLFYNNDRYTILLNDGQKTNYIISKGIESINGYSEMNPFQFRIYPDKNITIKNDSDGDIILNDLLVKKHKKNNNSISNNITVAENINFGDDKVSARINISEDGILATKIPYNKGWNLFVDGIKVDTKKVNYAFVGADIKKGQHTIEFRFEQYGFKIGVIISLVSLVLICIFETIKKFFLKKTRDFDKEIN